MPNGSKAVQKTTRPTGLRAGLWADCEDQTWAVSAAVLASTICASLTCNIFPVRAGASSPATLALSFLSAGAFLPQAPCLWPRLRRDPDSGLIWRGKTGADWHTYASIIPLGGTSGVGSRMGLMSGWFKASANFFGGAGPKTCRAAPLWCASRLGMIALGRWCYMRPVSTRTTIIIRMTPMTPMPLWP